MDNSRDNEEGLIEMELQVLEEDYGLQLDQLIRSELLKGIVIKSLIPICLRKIEEEVFAYYSLEAVSTDDRILIINII